MNAKDGMWQNPGFEQADDHPAVCINWDDAIAFCKWMGKKTGRAIGLPTEAQWEHACRAGVATTYLWGDDLAGGAGWCNAYDQATTAKLGGRTPITWADGFAFTSPVGKFKPNNFGLYDMLGNAEQWCSDWFDWKSYPTVPRADPIGPASGGGRSLRGAGWNSNAPHIAHRGMYHPDGTTNGNGLRVICTDVEKK